MSPLAAHAGYAILWGSFGLGHSLLAGSRVKAVLQPPLGRFYRLVYNLVATLHLAAVTALGWRVLGDLPALALPPFLGWGLLGLEAVGWIGFLWAARGYDLGRLAGLAQLRRPGQAEDEPLRIEGVHRWVRHPLYAFAFLILWGGARNPLGLDTAVWGSLYLLIGTWFEERKLLRLYGGAYATYRRRVPAFIPWRGRVPTAG